MLKRNAWMSIKIMRKAYVGVPQKYCESCFDRHPAIANPVKDDIRMSFVMVF